MNEPSIAKPPTLPRPLSKTFAEILVNILTRIEEVDKMFDEKFAPLTNLTPNNTASIAYYEDTTLPPLFSRYIEIANNIVVSIENIRYRIDSADF